MKYIVLNKKKNIKKVGNLIVKLNMKNTLKNKRTSIWENDDARISIDRYIIRILIYSSSDICKYSSMIL